MRPLLLCRERLTRILTVLEREGGVCTLRDLYRTYRIHDWEVEQAEESGWVNISERKPAVGRPSRVAEKLSKTQCAKLPPWRYTIPREISIRHWRFAMETVDFMNGGRFGFKVATAVHAYLKAFPNAKSRAGAYASASRLMKRRDVRIARLWFQRTTELRNYETMPGSPAAILERLKELKLI